jgi:uncharacterized protein with gpF-like domain
VFKASKERKKKDREPVGVGTILNSSAAIRSWYRRQMDTVIDAMVEDYKKEVNKALENNNVQKFFATDAAAASVFKKVLGVLERKWGDIFIGFAKATSQKFVDQSDDHAKSTTGFSLSTAGIEQPTMAYNSNTTNTLNAAKDFNHTLITGIQEDVHEKIYTAVMLSLTSPNPEEQGQVGIEKALREIGGFGKKRSKLIAADQTSKLYSALSDERLAQNGVEEFEWMHSSAGKVPRESHVEMDGHIFKLNDPRLWQVGGEFNLKKGDLGPPGWAIHCGCRRRPVIR